MAWEFWLRLCRRFVFNHDDDPIFDELPIHVRNTGLLYNIKHILTIAHA